MKIFTDQVTVVKNNCINYIDSYIRKHGDTDLKDYSISLIKEINSIVINPLPYELGSSRLINELDTDTLCYIADALKDIKYGL